MADEQRPKITGPVHEGLKQKKLTGPVHEGLATWGLLKDKGLPQFFAATLPTESLRQPENLLDKYLGKRKDRLAYDLQQRPDHYSDRQKEIIRNIQQPGTHIRPPTSHELNQLLMTLVAPTKAAQRSKDLVTRVSNARHGAEESESTFEAQDFGDRIII